MRRPIKYDVPLIGRPSLLLLLLLPPLILSFPLVFIQSMQRGGEVHPDDHGEQRRRERRRLKGDGLSPSTGGIIFGRNGDGSDMEGGRAGDRGGGKEWAEQAGQND